MLRADSGLCRGPVRGRASVKFPMVRLRLRGERRERHGSGGGGRGGRIRGGGERLQHQGQRGSGRWPHRRRRRCVARAGYRGRGSPGLLQALRLVPPSRHPHLTAGAGLEVSRHVRNLILEEIKRAGRHIPPFVCVCVNFLRLCMIVYDVPLNIPSYVSTLM